MMENDGEQFNLIPSHFILCWVVVLTAGLCCEFVERFLPARIYSTDM